MVPLERLAMFVGVCLFAFKKTDSSQVPPLPTPSPERRPVQSPGLSAIDYERFRDEHGYESRFRSPGQREGIAKILMDDVDA